MGTKNSTQKRLKTQTDEQQVQNQYTQKDILMQKLAERLKFSTQTLEGIIQFIEQNNYQLDPGLLNNPDQGILGKGGKGLVLKATDKKNGKVAIKLLKCKSDYQKNQNEEEFQNLQRFNSKYISDIYSLGIVFLEMTQVDTNNRYKLEELIELMQLIIEVEKNASKKHGKNQEETEYLQDESQEEYQNHDEEEHEIQGETEQQEEENQEKLEEEDEEEEEEEEEEDEEEEENQKNQKKRIKRKKKKKQKIKKKRKKIKKKNIKRKRKRKRKKKRSRSRLKQFKQTKNILKKTIRQTFRLQILKYI
ncbi:hypothetical protein IMG5_171980 [Ichthyophthirius multifiliis]|uniref:Protein kinase-like domain n=1 Tax=Ichthyophthirius multifiliis TaxID=5932 RepID=G0R1Q0_ICHMU|nr:hypothetical protein IMG5_171980 [Ichthyophthirius multifiliis]EGR28610.1 hypothetical protein IMG5_171980 [Ichthyophthirius multifiliis]|eukprot:XP_004029846.1 hypothetical protein IMG5_171980 [Ichthyophthirius multifiliis]